jgi:hypothetical protein
MTTIQTYAREIRSHRATAGAATRQAKKHALFAADCYEQAASFRKHAAALMAYGRRWAQDAAEWEHMARVSERLGDKYIQHSAFQDGQAEFYKNLAARYAAMSRPIEIEES